MFSRSSFLMGLALAATALVVVSSQVVAQTTDEANATVQVNRNQRLETKKVRVENAQERVSDRQEATGERKDEAIANRCEQVSAAIESRLANYDSMKEFRVNRYQSMKEQVSALITRLDEGGYDTTKIKTELDEFDALVQIFASDASAAAEALRGTKSFACGDSQGEFKTQLEKAKAAFSKAAASAKAVGEHYRTQLKPALQSLKEQAKVKQTERKSTNE